MPSRASRGEVWLADLDPSTGHEQGRRRPVLIVSDDRYNHGRGEMVIIVPLTTRDRGVPLHVAIDPPEARREERSFAMCDQVRAISAERLEHSFGSVSRETMRLIEDRLRIVLAL